MLRIIKRIYIFLKRSYIIVLCRFIFAVEGRIGLTNQLERINDYKFLVKLLKIYGANIGENVIIRKGLYINNTSNKTTQKKPLSNLVIEDNVYIDAFVLIDLSSGITIKRNTRISCGVKIYTHLANHKRGNKSVNYNFGDVVIGKNCRLFPNVMVSSGVKINDNVLVGTGSVILGNQILNANSLYVGSPAILKKSF